jgi:hypothetical protein
MFAIDGRSLPVIAQFFARMPDPMQGTAPR